jgi:hypothetical protein
MDEVCFDVSCGCLEYMNVPLHNYMLQSPLSCAMQMIELSGYLSIEWCLVFWGATPQDSNPKQSNGQELAYDVRLCE